MKHTIILTLCILAASLFAETGKHKIATVYGTGIAFNEHYIVTTGDVARHSENLDSIVVIVNGLPIIARVEHSADTVLDKENNSYMNMAIIQVDNKVLLNACKIDDNPVTYGPVTVNGYKRDGKEVQAQAFQAKVIPDSTFTVNLANALNVRTPVGFSGAAISRNGKVIGMSFGNSTSNPNMSFFYNGILLNEYILHQNRPTTTDISTCTYHVRSYVTVH